MCAHNSHACACFTTIYYFQDPIWYGVLNSSYSRLKPQLLLALTLEVELEVQSSQAQSLEVRGHVETGAEPSSLALTLDPSGGFYQLGPGSVAQQEMFTLSLTLQNARNLPPVSVKAGPGVWEGGELCH